ncbi:hypothetical protein H0H92_002352 [Tricholoma furcatifolium]|nr:hypothetical protein H0H92_002352 [Tricholoma furcatifolium]
MEVKDSDYFGMAFTALRHKNFAADKFEEELQNLRTRFVNKASDEYLFKPAYHKCIPADENQLQPQKNFKKHISEPVDLALNKAKPGMWDAILKTFKETLGKAEMTCLTKAKSFNCTERFFTASLQKCAWLRALRAGINIFRFPDMRHALAVVAESLLKMRTWLAEDNGVRCLFVNFAFKKAKDETIEPVPVDDTLEFSLPPESSDSLSGDDFDFPSTLVTETKMLEFTAKFRRDVNAYYVEAKRSTVASIAQIPLWMYGVLVVLGWKEAMVVLFNPLYFTLLLIALASAYAIVQLGLTGPLFQIAQTLVSYFARVSLSQVQRQATARREHFSEPVLAQPVRERTPSVRPKEEEIENESRRQLS